MTVTTTYVAKTMAGLEDVLSQELIQLGAKNIQPLVRAISFEADLETLYRANLWARTALRILKPIKTFTAHNEQVLYKRIQRIDWTEIIDIEQTFMINCHCHSDIYTHSLYVSQKVKDAIVDLYRWHTDGRRPSVDTRHPDVVIDVHCHDKEFTISLDSSGDSLHKRGYRQSERAAPLNEALAAGMIMLAEWDQRMTFYDPMCGSGTLLAEAYMIARRIAPRYKWTQFGFMTWPDYDEELWLRIKTEAEQSIIPLDVAIVGSELSRQEFIETRQLFRDLNWHEIELSCQNFLTSTAPTARGLMILNPPYGERVAADEDMVQLYKSIGDTFKHQYKGWSAWILSGNMAAIKQVGLKTSRKLHLFNGPIACKYHKYDMY